MLRWLCLIVFCCMASDGDARGQGTAAVTARFTADGVRAVIQLDRVVTRFEFAPGDVERAEDFQILTPGLRLDGDAVIATRPFRRFEVLVRPLARERDAKYPAYFRVGEGGVLYAPALRAEQSTWRTRLRAPTARGQVRLPSGNVVNIDGFIFVGPSIYVDERDGVAVVAAPDTPSALRERVAGTLAIAMRLFTQRLRAELPTPPTIVLAQGGEGSGFVGDVTPGPFMALRFYGPPADQVSEGNTQWVMRYITHEAFHFWNGSLVRNDENAPSWLHEGGADFAALLGGLETGALDEAGMREALGHALTGCRKGLVSQGDVAMNDLEFLPMGVRYPCGIVIQWAATLNVGRASGGERGFFDVWAAMIDAAEQRPARAFTLTDFYDAAGVDPDAPLPVIRLLTQERGDARWDELVSALRQQGAGIDVAPTPDTRMSTVIFHLLRQACSSGSFGYYEDGATITLDAGDQCGSLAGNPVLTEIEGAPVTAINAEAYAAMQVRCAARRELHVELGDGRAVTVACRSALADAPNAYTVHAWR